MATRSREKLISFEKSGEMSFTKRLSEYSSEPPTVSEHERLEEKKVLRI